MRGHNICFHSGIRKIIFELSILPLKWSSGGTLGCNTVFMGVLLILGNLITIDPLKNTTTKNQIFNCCRIVLQNTCIVCR